MLVTLHPTLSPADGLALIVRNLREAIGARWGRRQVAEALAALLLARLGRLVARFAALAARVRAGAATAAPTARRRETAAPRSARPRLPEGFGWLCRLLPEAACFGSQLRHLLSLPATRALLADAPQLGRVLFPLCRMLAVEPDAEVREGLPGYKTRQGAGRRRSAVSPSDERSPDERSPIASSPAPWRSGSKPLDTPGWPCPDDGTPCAAGDHGPGLARFTPRAGPLPRG